MKALSEATFQEEQLKKPKVWHRNKQTKKASLSNYMLVVFKFGKDGRSWLKSFLGDIKGPDQTW